MSGDFMNENQTGMTKESLDQMLVDKQHAAWKEKHDADPDNAFFLFAENFARRNAQGAAASAQIREKREASFALIKAEIFDRAGEIAANMAKGKPTALRHE